MQLTPQAFQYTVQPRFASGEKSTETSPPPAKPALKEPIRPKEASLPPSPKTYKGMAKVLGALLLGSAALNIGQGVRNQTLSTKLTTHQDALISTIRNSQLTLNMEIKDFMAQVNATAPHVTSKKETDGEKRAAFTVGNQAFELFITPALGYYRLESTTSPLRTPVLEFYSKGHNFPVPGEPTLLWTQADRQLDNLKDFNATVRRESADLEVKKRVGQFFTDLENKLFTQAP